MQVSLPWPCQSGGTLGEVFDGRQSALSPWRMAVTPGCEGLKNLLTGPSQGILNAFKRQTGPEENTQVEMGNSQ